MPNKKLTDAEIIKALEYCIGWENCKEKQCPMINECKKDVDASYRYALDLINRLQEDVENYKQIAENQQKITMDRGFEIKRLKKKIENLQAENKEWKRVVETWVEQHEKDTVEIERLKGENAVVLLKPENAQFENLEHFETRQISKEMLPAIVRRTKVEAYKEFANRLESELGGLFLIKHKVVCDVIDNLLKELVGEDNG